MLKSIQGKFYAQRKVVLAGTVATFATLAPELALAITAPADTAAFGYDLYDVAVNDMLKGPAGFVGGLAAIIVSAINVTKNWMMAAAGVLGGTALIKADSIVSSMGMLI